MLSKDPNPNLGPVERSGRFTTNSNLVAFVYELLRDHVLPGDMQKIVDDSDVHPNREMTYDTGPTWQLSNGWLARYARDIVRRLILDDYERKALKFTVDMLYKLSPNDLTDEEKKLRADAINRLNRFVNDV